MELPAAPGADGIVIQVRLTPKSGTGRIAGAMQHGERAVLKAHVTAPPEDGKANAALIALIAGWLGVAKSRVTLAAGQKSRLKSVAVAGDAAELIARLEQLLSGSSNAKRKM